MTQISQPWDGVVIGHASRAPYNASEWDDMFEDMFNSDVDRGVLANRGNELVGSIPVANTFRIATGAALVKGKWYKNDANVDFTVPAATAGNYRRDRIVLSSTWANINSAARDPAVQVAQTIQLIRLINPVENAAAPAMTKTDGTLWEISLYRIQVSDAGAVIIYADDREFANAPTSPKRLFVPVVMAWNTTDGTVIVPNTSPIYGWPFPDLKSCRAVGFGIVPSDFVRALTARAVIIPTIVGTLDIYGELMSSYGQCGEAWNAHTDSSGWVAVAVTNYDHECINSIDLDDAAVGDIVHLRYIRDATDVLDTLGTSCRILGFLLEYVGRS